MTACDAGALLSTRFPKKQTRKFGQQYNGHQTFTADCERRDRRKRQID